jgi:hypothetical protein
MDEIDYLINILKKNKIKISDICIVGSFVLDLKGIRSNADLDILLLSFKKSYVNKNKLSKNIELVGFGWGECFGVSDDDLINDNRYWFKYKKLKVIKLEVLFVKKILTKRDKDVNDIELIEEYIFNNSSKFDWSLFKELMLNANLNIVNSNKFHSYLTKGLKDPKKAIEVINKKLKRNNEKGFSLISNQLSSQLNITIPINALFGNHFINGELIRYDLLLRYYTIDMLLKNKYPKNYCLMQKLRVGKMDCDEFKRLVYSFKKNGFLKEYPIPISKKGTILDGSHRLACALYFNIKEIPVKIVSTNHVVNYNKSWFLNNKFNKNLLKKLDIIEKKLLIENGIYFPVVLWNPAKKYFKNISDDIKKEHKCVYEKKLEIKNLKKFLLDIYEIDDIDKWKIMLKNELMTNKNQEIYFMLIEIKNPMFRKKQRGNSYLSNTCAKLKASVRQKYKNKIKNYFPDIIIHIGDNYEHNSEIIKIVEQIDDFGKEMF